MELTRKKIKDLKPHPKNPRVHPDSVIKKLEQSIKRYGWTNPVLVNKDGYILAGHARVKAAQKAGQDEVPVIILDMDGKKAEAYMIADNRVQEDGEWDISRLNEVLADLIKSDIDLVLAAGFDNYEIDRFLKEDAETEFIPRENIRLADEFNEVYEEKVVEEEKKEKPPAKGDHNWFYVEYYGQDEKFLTLIEKCKKLGVLVDTNKLDKNYFYNLANKALRGIGA